MIVYYTIRIKHFTDDIDYEIKYSKKILILQYMCVTPRPCWSSVIIKLSYATRCLRRCIRRYRLHGGAHGLKIDAFYEPRVTNYWRGLLYNLIYACDSKFVLSEGQVTLKFLLRVLAGRCHNVFSITDIPNLKIRL